ncbi:MAG: extracellular solute-binding protein [Phycisphaeraceae bacterium]|nr:extracellular solute-binding protein [Phycisphaeraceae bacterium]
MREHLPKIIIIGLLVLIVGVPILLRPANRADSDPNAPQLVVYTPHNEQIRFEIQTAFNAWRVANELPAVVFDWRTPGGTSDIRKSILSQYTQAIGAGKDLDEAGIGADLFFGGGEYDHNKVAEGIEREVNGNEVNHRIVMDPQLDPALFAKAFPQPLIGGEKLYGTYTFEEDGGAVEIVGWTGVTLSSFGIVYNRDTLKQIGLDEPKTWSDLGDPRLRGWIALADPGHSGSISATFETILKREGWAQGWVTLRNAFANARYFATSADRVPVDVSRGDAAVGMCIDFYGRYQSGAVGDDRVGYSDPVVDGQSMTATTADPITLLRGAPNPELAREFVAWLLTPDAQALWQRSLGDGTDELVRPRQFELRRQPLRSDLYTDAARASWVDKELNPYPTAVPFPEGTPGYFSMVAPVTKAMASEIHHDMVAAWRALNTAVKADHPKVDEMRALFYAMPPELTLAWPDAGLADNWLAIQRDTGHPRHSEVIERLAAFKEQLGQLSDRNDPSVIEANRIKWRSFFQDNYRKVVELARS